MKSRLDKKGVGRRLVFSAVALLFLGLMAGASVAAGRAGLVVGALPLAAGPVDPLRDPCAHEGRLCNPAARVNQVAANLEAQPPTGVVLNRDSVERIARGMARTPITPEAPPDAIIFSALMSRSEYEAISREGSNYAVNRERQIWVITVHAPTATSGSAARPPAVFPAYSVALDAETGQWTDACIGCEWLARSR